MVDALLAAKLADFVERICVTPHEFVKPFHGARKFTQPLDITHAIQLLIEKGMDSQSPAGIAQMDIEKYCDSIRLLLIAAWLLDHGCCMRLVTSILRQQLLPSLQVVVGNIQFCVSGRSKGTLTGSRVAGECGRIPVEDTIAKLLPELSPLGFEVGAGRLTIATFVDNLFAFCDSAANAEKQLDLVAAALAECWDLRIKDGSRQFMACHGSTNEPLSVHTWQRTSEFAALGHIISSDGGVSACFRHTQRLLWKSFFANAGHKRFIAAPLKLKLRLAERATKPVWSYRCTRWPPSKGILKMEARFQNRMVAAMQRLRPTIGESPACFMARRNKAAATLARSHGTWAAEHIRRCERWYEHLHRPANSCSFAAHLLRHQDAMWIRQRRKQLRPNTAPRGTATRVSRGPIAARWEEALLNA